MVVGATRLGKTEWARSLGRHIYMCGLFNLAVWDNEAEYLVWDDMSFDKIGGVRKGLWGAQKELTLHDKFARKRSVKWGKPMIFLCNKDNDFRYMLDKSGRNKLLSLDETEWYEDNCVIVEVNTRLYNPP
jgi:hypothetical protein